jgi:hypothetical protein
MLTLYETLGVTRSRYLYQNLVCTQFSDACIGPTRQQRPTSNVASPSGQAAHMKTKELEAGDSGTKHAFNLCRNAIDVLITRLEIRFGPQNFNSDDQQPYLIATYLHPAYKNFSIITDDTARARVINKVKALVRQQLKQKFEPTDKQKEPVVPEEVCPLANASEC